MSKKHQWVTFAKGRVQVTGCATCGEVMLHSNQHMSCESGDKEGSMLHQKGFAVVKARAGDNQQAA